MATITEKLVLKDVFSETFARYIKAAQKAASATADAQKALYGFMAASQITAAQQHASTTAAQQNAGAQEQAAQDMTAAHQADPNAGRTHTGGSALCRCPSLCG